MTPDISKYRPERDYFLSLIAKTGKSRAWCGRQLGISATRITYLAKGERNQNGKIYPVHMTYVEQFALECLAEGMSIANKK